MRTTQMQALVNATLTPHTSVDAMMGDATGALNALGVRTRLMLYASACPNPDLAWRLVCQLREDELPCFMMNVNAKEQIMAGGVNIHDAWGIPQVALMVDHPALHIEHLLKAPENAVICVIDEGHLRFLADAGFKPRTHLFCPHGGPEAVPDPLPAVERPIDVLFIGNVVDPGPVKAWLDAQSGGDAVRRGVLADAYEAVSAGAEVYVALSEAFQRGGLDAHPHALAPVIRALDAYVAQSRRLDVLTAVTGRQITICGEVSERAAARLGYHDLRGEVPFAYALSLMAEAKVVVNSRRTFARGAHERNFYALSRGAVVATEPSTFLADDLEQGLGMVRLPEKAGDIDALLSSLCTDTAELDALRARGLAEYPERHSWRERMGRILPAVMAHLE